MPKWCVCWRESLPRWRILPPKFVNCRDLKSASFSNISKRKSRLAVQRCLTNGILRLCERICGLARIARSLVVPALEDVTTWHERDLTQSSAERFIFPEICILTDYMLFLMNNIIDNLRVDEQKMSSNIELTQGRLMSEAVMMALAKKGMNRQEAHELMRKLTLKSELREATF